MYFGVAVDFKYFPVSSLSSIEKLQRIAKPDCKFDRAQLMMSPMSFQDPLQGLEISWPPGLLPLMRRCFERQHRMRPTMEALLQEMTAGESRVVQ